MKEKKWTGVLAILVTVFLWGISFVNIRVAIQVLPAMTLGALRFAIASILLTIVMKLQNQNFTVDKKDWPSILLAGAVGITVYFYFENNGVKYTSASAASLIIASIPVFSVLVESLLYKTKISMKTIVALLLSITGVAMVVGLDTEELFHSGYIKGYLMMGGAVVSWVVYAITSKPLFLKYTQLKLLFWQSWIGLACFVPFALFESTPWEAVDKSIWGHVVILGVFASAVGFYLYLYALDVLGLGGSSYYLNLIPVVTIIAGYFYLGESLGLLQLTGGGIIVFSVMLVSSNGRKNKEKKEKKRIQAENTRWG